MVSVWRPTPTSWRAEYYILTRRPDEHVFCGQVDIDPTTFPAEVQDELSIDEKYMINEAKQQAEIVVIEELSKLAQQQQDPELEYLPTGLESTIMTLGTLWRLGTYKAALQKIASTTGSKELKLHLSIAFSIRLGSNA
ncbi:hypothetical protein C4F17_26865 [Variovorax sp. PMC12]|nr:hypothetical protein C4F17_26865 [Variovorax sp. PMC12]